MKSKIFKPSKTEKIGLKFLDKDSKNIYSVGISTGGSAEINMLSKAKQAKIVATTLSENGLQFTNKILQECSISNIETKIEDISEHISYPENFFDYIYARLVLHYLDDRKLEYALKQIYNTLKEKGKLFVVVRTPKEWELKVFPDETIYDKTTGFTEYWVQGKKEERVKRNFIDKNKLTSLLKDVGFNIIKIKHTKEYLYLDYNRTTKSKKANNLLWCIAKK